jgi:hypothetical protein
MSVNLDKEEVDAIVDYFKSARYVHLFAQNIRLTTSNTPHVVARVFERCLKEQQTR